MPVAMVFRSFTMQCLSPIQPDEPNKIVDPALPAPQLPLSFLANKHAPSLAIVSGKRDPMLNWKKRGLDKTERADAHYVKQHSGVPACSVRKAA